MATIDQTYVGKPVATLNAERSVRGQAIYLADVHQPGELHVAILRSSEPHARIKSIDTAAARALPGVKQVLTGAEIVDVIQPQVCSFAFAGQRDPETRPLAIDVVRYVGEPVAVVVAVDPFIAEDARDLIRVAYQPLPVVIDPEAALAPDAPRLYPDWPDNVVASTQTIAGDAAQALADADTIVAETFITQRVAPLSMECRGVLAAYDPGTESLTVWSSTQVVHQVRTAISQTLGLPEHRIRVIAPLLGGSFGAKAFAYIEETLIPYLALRLGRPVRWIEDRNESLLAMAHARDIAVKYEIGFRGDGTITGLRARVLFDCGASPYVSSISTATTTGVVLCGPYKVGHCAIDVLGVVTNKTPSGGYRGFGQPEANFALERSLDIAAARLGLDPAEIRRRNFVAPDEMPYACATGVMLDSGRYAELLDLALTKIGYDDVKQQIAESRAQGGMLGVGIASYIEGTNFAPSWLVPLVGRQDSGFDTVIVRVELSGHVRVFSNQTPMGQGIDTVLAQIVADELGVQLADINVTCGDTLLSGYAGYGSGASRGAGVTGAATKLAAGRIREKMRKIAAHLLEADEADLELGSGGFAVRGVPGRRVTIAEIARAAYLIVNLPAGMEPGLEVTQSYEPPSLAVSYGVAVAIVEVLPATGQIQLRRMVYGHDCGPQINPRIVEGQIRGGAVQGIGATLYEELRYTDDGRPLVTNLRQYPVPTAADVPSIEMLHLETPSPFSLTGVKGVGEGGVIPIPAAIANAVQCALPLDAPQITTLPLRPDAILSALDSLLESR
ncbi:MAG TPA: xanthine dehydrogenase family protein molybdopterin-binding subunit [Herpetosiphonaceae bacterium]